MNCLAQSLAQVPDEGGNLVLIEALSEWKDAAIVRLQKSYDTVHEPVVVPLFRIDLRHVSPLATRRAWDIRPFRVGSHRPAAFYPDW